MKHYKKVCKYIEIAEKYGFKFYAVRNKYYPSEFYLKLKYEPKEYLMELVSPIHSPSKDGTAYWHTSVNVTWYADVYGDLLDKTIKDLADYWLKVNALNRELNEVKMPYFSGNAEKDVWFYMAMTDGYKEIGKRFMIKDSE
jgi:hypothetical protein